MTNLLPSVRTNLVQGRRGDGHGVGDRAGGAARGWRGRDGRPLRADRPVERRGGGSFYTTELTLANRGTTPATVEVMYTAAFGEGSGKFREPLQPGEQKVIPDAIAFLVARGLPLPATGNRGGTLRFTFYGSVVGGRGRRHREDDDGDLVRRSR